MTTTRPTLNHSEKAARTLLNDKVRAGIISRHEANKLLKFALPFCRSQLAQWRREGTDPQWITSTLQQKLTDAKQQRNRARGAVAQRLATCRVVSAEMFLAIWAGLQADCAEHTANRPAALPATPSARREIAD